MLDAVQYISSANTEAEQAKILEEFHSFLKI